MYLYGGIPKPVAFGILFLFSLYLGLYHALFAALFASIRRGKFGAAGALLLAPFLWVAVELIRGRLSGFPWDLLGYSQIENLWLTRIAPVAGVMAMSFVIVAINAALASYFVLHGARRWSVVVAAVVFASVLQYGSYVDAHTLTPAPDQTVIMVQENLAVGEAAKEIEPIYPAEELQVFSQMTRDPHRVGSSVAAPTVIVWPEAPSHFFSVDRSFRQGIGDLARSMRAPAIVGTLGLELSGQSPPSYLEYDSAALFDATGIYQGRYDKVHLVPWGEYVPFPSLFGFAHKLTEGVGDMQPGTKRTVFSSNGHRYGTFICYESIFGDEVRQFVQNGADVLVNISNDGWYGDTGAPWQHLNMTRMRAIENNRWLLLDTNTGVTTAIDPHGRETAEAPRHVRGAYQFPFAFISGTTFYTQHGDWFAWLCAVCSALAVGVCLVQGVRTSTSKWSDLERR